MEAIITVAVGFATGAVTVSVSRSLNARYLQKLRTLAVEMKFLENLRGQIEEEIDEARTRGEVIEPVVSDWLNDVDEKNREIEELMHSVAAKESIQCLRFSCPNLVWRYKLGKKIDRKLGDLDFLVTRGNFADVSHPALQRELQLTSIDETNDHASFDSETPVFRKIMEAVRDSKVNMIGVYGMEVKKLKMMTKVVQQVGREGLFDKVMAIGVSRCSNTSAIQSQLAHILTLQLVKRPEVGRAIQLWCRLNNGKRNLIIVDGLSEELNLMDIGIPIPDGDRGCKVLLTSHNRGVWKNMQVDVDFPIN